MSNVTSQWAKATLPTGGASSYRHSSLALGRGGRGEIRLELPIGTGNLASGDEWSFIRVPEDTIIEDMYLTVPELDEGSALTLLVKSTDGTTTTTHLSANTVGQAGGTVRANTSLPRLGGAEIVRIYVEVGTGATTAKAGKATLVVHATRK